MRNKTISLFMLVLVVLISGCNKYYRDYFLDNYDRNTEEGARAIDETYNFGDFRIDRWIVGSFGLHHLADLSYSVSITLYAGDCNSCSDPAFSRNLDVEDFNILMHEEQVRLKLFPEKITTCCDSLFEYKSWYYGRYEFDNNPDSIGVQFQVEYVLDGEEKSTKVDLTLYYKHDSERLFPDYLFD